MKNTPHRPIDAVAIAALYVGMIWNMTGCNRGESNATPTNADARVSAPSPPLAPTSSKPSSTPPSPDAALPSESEARPKVWTDEIPRRASQFQLGFIEQSAHESILAEVAQSFARAPHTPLSASAGKAWIVLDPQAIADASKHSIRAACARNAKRGMTLRQEGEVVREAIEAFVAATAAADLTNTRRQTLLHLADSEMQEGSLRPYQHWLLQAVTTFPECDPWIGRMLVARALIRKGWEVRGDNFAGSVSPADMKKFHGYLRDAQRRLLEAWLMHAECSEAAVELIAVTMAIGGATGETTRFWFDRAVAADFDNPGAYEKMMWSLLPRWGGSHEELLAFGRECLATKRFDTTTPWRYHEAIKMIAMENEDRFAVFAAPEIFEDYQTLLLGYRETAVADESRRLRDSQLVAAAFLSGRREEAKQLLTAMSGPPQAEAFRDFGLNYATVKRKLNFDQPNDATKDFPHAGAIRSLAWSRNGKGLITVGDEGKTRMWSAAGRKLLSELTGHEGAVAKQAISPDGETLATAGMDGTVRLWKLADRLELASLIHPWPVRTVAFHPSGTLLASGGGGYEGEVVLWDLQTRQRLGAFGGHATPVVALAFSPHGDSFASLAGASDEIPAELAIWDVESRTPKHLVKPFTNGITALAYSNDGATLAVAGSERILDTWGATNYCGFWLLDVETGDHRKLLPGSLSAVWSLSFADDDRALIAAGAGGAVKIWSVETGELLARLAGHSGNVLSAQVSPDGSSLASADDRGRMRIWPLEKGAWRSQSHGPLADFIAEGGVSSMCYTPDKKSLLVASRHGGCTLWRLDDNYETPTVLAVPPTLDLYEAALSRDGVLLAIAGNDRVHPDRSLLLLDVASGEISRPLSSHGGRAQVAQFSPDGRTFASAGGDGEVALWRLDTFKRYTWGHIKYLQPVSAAAFSADGSLLAMAQGQSFTIYDVPAKRDRETKAIAARYSVNTLPRQALCLRFSPDGALLLVGYRDTQVYEVATRRLLFTVPGWFADFSPNGAAFATGGMAKAPTDVAIWETATGRELTRFTGGHEKGVSAILFSPDGKRLLTGDHDGRVVNWDVAAGAQSLDYGLPPMETLATSEAAASAIEMMAAATARSTGRGDLVNSIGMDLVLVEPGEFLMGSPGAEAGRGDDERQHVVRLTKPYYIGKFEVTQEDYERVIGANPSQFAYQGLLREKVLQIDPKHLPVENVTWNQAVEYCRRLSEMPAERAAGRAYRLPTEAEWEYACRGGAATAFCFGDTLSSLQANFNGDAPYGSAEKGPNVGQTVMVGSYEPNGLGLYDMHGNVWEWCQDRYGPYPEGMDVDPQGAAPQGAVEGERRVLRGSCFFLGANTARSAQRNKEPPDHHAPNLGFRVVCEAASTSRN